MSKFLLLLGPSGVGKSALIHELIRLDARFVYISPYTTRPLRAGETNKIHISAAQMDEMDGRGEFLVVNELYGIRYATPRAPILQAFAAGNFPVLDWPVDRLRVMTEAFPRQLCVVYVAPPSMVVLEDRLGRDGRDESGSRMALARDELEAYWRGDYDPLIDHRVVSEEGHLPALSQRIYSLYTEDVR